MSQTRTVHQVKRSPIELANMFRTMALEILVTENAITQEQAAELTSTNMNWRGAPDGGMVFTLDPVWPAE